MKTITLLKIVTAVLSIAILICFFAVLSKITDITPKSKRFPQKQSEILLAETEKISKTMPCGENLCLLTDGHENGARLIIVNPKRGQAEYVLTFQNEERHVSQ